jgi:hypothetical protein
MASTLDHLPDEITVRQTIAEKTREIKLLRAVEKALAQASRGKRKG